MQKYGKLIKKLDNVLDELRQLEKEDFGIEDYELRIRLKAWFEAIEQLIQGLHCEIRYESIEALSLDSKTAQNKKK